MKGRGCLSSLLRVQIEDLGYQQYFLPINEWPQGIFGAARKEIDGSYFYGYVKMVSLQGQKSLSHARSPSLIMCNGLLATPKPRPGWSPLGVLNSNFPRSIPTPFYTEVPLLGRDPGTRRIMRPSA